MIEFESLLALMVVVWLGGKIFRELRLPVLFGELLAGLLVGPQILGIVHETQTISILAELGIFFLMLHAGLENDPRILLKASKKTLFITAGSIMLPVLSGFGLAYLFGYNFVVSAFVAIFISVTAITVSSRVFKDHKLLNSDISQTVLTVALFSDIVSLLMFTALHDVYDIGYFDPLHILIMLGKAMIYFGLVLFVGERFFTQINRIIYRGNKGFTFTLIIALAFGFVAEKLGLHAVLGAFLAGLFIRGEVIEEKLFHKIEDRIYGLSYSFLGPIFFASLALHVNFDAFINSPFFVIAIVLVAFVSKFLGTYIAGMQVGCSKLESTIMGISTNTRGAVELVLSSIALSLGMITDEVFSVLVSVAIFTTILAIILMQMVIKRTHMKLLK